MRARVLLRLPPPWLVAVVGCALLYLAAWHQYCGPAPRALDAPLAEFSAARAWRMLQYVLGDESPHPAGTPQNAEVRQRLIDQLERLGMEVQTQPAVADGSGTLPLTNVLARLPAANATGCPLLLVTHYDSTPFGPGASDAGSCVAALLECARALRAGVPLPRPVYFLFTDGEEDGLLGARLFVQQHPLAAQRPCVLNFDARGSSGASLLYETSGNNLALIGRAARSLPRPAGGASSFVTVYRWLPNDSDFTVFREAGWAGLNCGSIGGAHQYHNAADNLANLDPRTVQHHGENALALARSLGAVDEPQLTATQDAVFCDVLGLTVIWHAASWSLRLAVLALAVLVCAERKMLLSGGRQAEAPTFSMESELERDDAASGSVWRALWELAVGLVEVVGLAALAGWSVSRVYLAVGGAEHPTRWIGVLMASLFWLIAAGLTLGRGIRGRHSAGSHSRWLATWLVCSVVGVVVGGLLPGFSYLLSLPCLLAGCIAWSPGDRRWWSVVTTWGGALLWLPALHLFTVAVGPHFGHLLCPAFALALLPLVMQWGR